MDEVQDYPWNAQFYHPDAAQDSRVAEARLRAEKRVSGQCRRKGCFEKRYTYGFCQAHFEERQKALRQRKKKQQMAQAASAALPRPSPQAKRRQAPAA